MQHAIAWSAALLLLSGCNSIGAGAGAVAGTVSGIFTANPAVGIGVGIAVQSATDEAVSRTMKRLHKDQQDTIVQIATQLPIGQTQPWKVSHTLPLENGEGEVRVLREFTTALTNCKEFAFSVKDGAKTDWYIAQACQQGTAWEWATAEPAVKRWGNLQ